MRRELGGRGPVQLPICTAPGRVLQRSANISLRENEGTSRGRARPGSLLLPETSLCGLGEKGRGKNWPRFMIMEVPTIPAAPLRSQAAQMKGPRLPDAHSKIISPPPCNLT